MGIFYFKDGWVKLKVSGKRESPNESFFDGWVACGQSGSDNWPPSRRRGEQVGLDRELGKRYARVLRGQAPLGGQGLLVESKLGSIIGPQPQEGCCGLSWSPILSFLFDDLLKRTYPLVYCSQ